MPRSLSRLLVVLASGALLAGAGSAAGISASPEATAAFTPTFARSLETEPHAILRPARLARTASDWRGGPTTASTGEVVDVRVSTDLPIETSTPERWAEFIAGLTHGPEISLLTAYITTLDEVQEVCGDRALGCYSANQTVVPGEVLPDGTSPEEVIRHEYGHHVAYNRVNTPWVAVDWGPKNWASVANVCARVARQEAFPGNESTNYALNPGEAWAEVYRLMDERKAGILTATWPIIAPSFYPSEEALVAADRDVLEPWTKETTTLYTRVYGKKTKKVWWIPLRTPLDGDLRVSATLPRAGEHEVAILSADRKTVVGRAQWTGQRVKRYTGSVCGQRSLFVRVTRVGGIGRTRVAVTTP